VWGIPNLDLSRFGVTTPGVASSPSSVSATAESVVVIGVWSNCFRPETTSARPGQLIQWQAIEAGIAPELVLEDGTSLGLVRHVLEFRFGQPGTYRYHVRNSAQVTATVIMR
jgi:plastocyanin